MRLTRKTSDASGATSGRIPLASLVRALMVAQHLNFRHAAKVLDTTQSSVSTRFKALEETLGVLLFERRYPGVRLTEAGRRFVAEVSVGIGHIAHAIQTAGSIAAAFLHILQKKGFLPGRTPTVGDGRRSIRGGRAEKQDRPDRTHCTPPVGALDLPAHLILAWVHRRRGHARAASRLRVFMPASDPLLRCGILLDRHAAALEQPQQGVFHIVGGVRQGDHAQSGAPSGVQHLGCQHPAQVAVPVVGILGRGDFQPIQARHPAGRGDHRIAGDGAEDNQTGEIESGTERGDSRLVGQAMAEMACRLRLPAEMRHQRGAVSLAQTAYPQPGKGRFAGNDIEAGRRAAPGAPRYFGIVEAKIGHDRLPSSGLPHRGTPLDKGCHPQRAVNVRYRTAWLP